MDENIKESLETLYKILDKDEKDILLKFERYLIASIMEKDAYACKLNELGIDTSNMDFPESLWK